MEEDVTVITDPKIFCFNFDVPKDVYIWYTPNHIYFISFTNNRTNIVIESLKNFENITFYRLYTKV